MIFGTDWPGIPGIAANARAVARLMPDEETAAQVLAGNATRVYNLKTRLQLGSGRSSSSDATRTGAPVTAARLIASLGRASTTAPPRSVTCA